MAQCLLVEKHGNYLVYTLKFGEKMVNEIGTVIISEIGEIRISDRKTWELAKKLLDHAFEKEELRFYCDDCGKKGLEQYYSQEYHEELILNSESFTTKKIKVYCKKCASKHNLNEIVE